MRVPLLASTVGRPLVSASLAATVAPPPSAHRLTGKRPRSVRCGVCDGCVREDCGYCKNCVDKPKFGGTGQRKQGCIKKHCTQPRLAG